MQNILSTWSQVECVRFAVWCARRVARLNDDSRVEAAIKAAEQWLKDPGEVNAGFAAADAARAAYAAATDAAYAAYAADAARAAAYAADAARAAAYAAYAAARAAADAADAAGACGRADVTDYDLLQAYIGDQILNAVNT